MQLPCYFPVACHTDNVGHGTTFVVIKGNTHDGMEYVPLAIQKGASAIVVQHDVMIPADLHILLEQKSIRVERVDDTRRALAQLSAVASGHAAQKLQIIGVTGTKGKTTSVFLIEHVLKTVGYRTALLSSVKNSILDYQFSTTLTTQQPDYLHVFFAECVKVGVTHVVMEVAAQALTLHRTWGIEFSGILFTNFSHEHAEFYATQEDYFQAKNAIFAQKKATAPVAINADDPRGSQLLKNHPSYIGYSLCSNTLASYTTHVTSDVRYEISVAVHTPYEDHVLHSSVLQGLFNAYNCVGSYVLVCALGIDPRRAAQAYINFAGVPGRMERYVLANGALCYVDYAHNPSSYENLLSLLRSCTDHLIVVFGAGGGKDREKRPIMGALAVQYADLVVLTSDNPRMEDPSVIVEEILQGMQQTQKEWIVLLDRREAIEYAYTRSRSGSIIAVLGKGVDEYQMIGTTKYFFSDRQTVMRYLTQK